jgi:hypothetical protein
MSDCPECKYLREERAAIHEFDGKASRTEAERMASMERCKAHSGTEPVDKLEGLKIKVVMWEKNANQPGEYVGWPRTLAGPFRMGFDGSREVVIEKYRRWLFDEVKAKKKAFRKLEELLPAARREGVTLVCMEPDFGEVIARALQWMDSTEGRKDSAA